MFSMEVIGFGALNLDRIIHADDIPKPGEEIFLKSMNSFPGGSAANTIAGLAKLQVSTGFVGKVGDDAEGTELLESLMYLGVDTKNIKVTSGKSGTSIIMVNRSGERSILLDPGVNDIIETRDIAIDYFHGAKIFHMSSFVCKDSQKSLDTQKKLVKEIKAMGLKVSFDPGHLYAKKGSEIEELIRNTNIFFINEEEMRILTGMNYMEGAKSILAKGVDIVAVKLGSRGCFVTNGAMEFHVPAFGSNVIDTTGAGDAFNAGFLYGILNKKTLEECSRYGNAIASLCIQKSGARDGLPSKMELSGFLAMNK